MLSVPPGGASLHQVCPFPMQVFEYMESDLEALIKDRALILSEADVKSYMQMLLRALDVCHRHWVLHRDIKPNNFLIAASGPRPGPCASRARLLPCSRRCCKQCMACRPLCNSQGAFNMVASELSARGPCWPTSHDMRMYAWLGGVHAIRRRTLIAIVSGNA